MHMSSIVCTFNSDTCPNSHLYNYIVWPALSTTGAVCNNFICGFTEALYVKTAGFGAEDSHWAGCELVLCTPRRTHW